MALILAPDLYTKPPKTAIPGARWSYRTMAMTAAQVIAGIVAMGILPAGHWLLGYFLEVGAAMDTGNAGTVDIGILNTYYNQAPATVAVPAAYNSGGATNTGTAPALVSGQNVLTASTLIRAGGRIDYSALAFTAAIGKDDNLDRIVAIELKSINTGALGTIGLGLLIDEP